MAVNKVVQAILTNKEVVITLPTNFVSKTPMTATCRTLAEAVKIPDATKNPRYFENL